jgi:hypothetical protein
VWHKVSGPRSPFQKCVLCNGHHCVPQPQLTLAVACSGCIAGNVSVQLHYLVEYVTTLLQPQVELTLAEEYSMAGIIDETRRRSIGVACAGRIGRPDPL